ncbi:hypothetical protein EV424DRAFT_1349368 [Suillus variegatus]|nr:hypothetical protein EV424DRAFT_1349368 [Suillus variegatus]
MQAFDTADYQTFTTTLPNFDDIKAMVNSHFEQLPEGDLLVTLTTLNKIVEAQLVVALLLRMETALGEDVCTAIAATERLVKYLKKEGELAADLECGSDKSVAVTGVQWWTYSVALECTII